MLDSASACEEAPFKPTGGLSFGREGGNPDVELRKPNTQDSKQAFLWVYTPRTCWWKD